MTERTKGAVDALRMQVEEILRQTLPLLDYPDEGVRAAARELVDLCRRRLSLTMPS